MDVKGEGETFSSKIHVSNFISWPQLLRKNGWKHSITPGSQNVREEAQGLCSFFKRMKKKLWKKEISTTKQGKGGSWCTGTYFPKCTSHNSAPEFEREGTLELGCFWEQGCPAVLTDEVQSSHCYLIHFGLACPMPTLLEEWCQAVFLHFNGVTHDVATKAL